MNVPLKTIVYLVVNKVNGKIYIGYTKKSLKVRRSQHVSDATAKRGGCRIFNAAIRKYGEENFGWFVISEHPSKADGLCAEIAAISKYKPEYNISHGGQGTNGVPWTEDRKVQMRDFMKGRVMTPKQREKWYKTYSEGGYGKPVICVDDGLIFKSSAAAQRHYGISISSVLSGKTYFAGGKVFQYGNSIISKEERERIVENARVKRVEKPRGRPAGTWSHSQEARDKISAKNKGNKFHLGKKHTDEVKDKLRKAALGRIETFKIYAAMGPKASSRPVICLDTGELFDSASAAARKFSIAKSSLIELCLGQKGRKSVGGLKFKYSDGPK